MPSAAKERPKTPATLPSLGFPGCLTGVIDYPALTPMTKTQVYLREEELKALHEAAKRTSKSVAELIREAIRQVWVRPQGQGPVALWDGELRRSSVEHDGIYDEP